MRVDFSPFPSNHIHKCEEAEEVRQWYKRGAAQCQESPRVSIPAILSTAV